MKDNVNSPNHYTKGKMEVIDILENSLTSEQFKGFLIGNVIKYILRYPDKNGLEDLDKEIWYSKKLREVVEKEERDV